MSKRISNLNMQTCQGRHSFFQNFFQVFQTSCRFLKIRIFECKFSSLRLKTVLDSIKTLKKYFKATLNMFFFLIFNDDKKIYL